MSTITQGPPQLWLAYYEDFSGLVVFASEIEALRHAVATRMSVKPVRCGEDLREQVRA